MIRVLLPGTQSLNFFLGLIAVYTDEFVYLDTVFIDISENTDFNYKIDVEKIFFIFYKIEIEKCIDKGGIEQGRGHYNIPCVDLCVKNFPKSAKMGKNWKKLEKIGKMKTPLIKGVSLF